MTFNEAQSTEYADKLIALNKLSTEEKADFVTWLQGEDTDTWPDNTIVVDKFRTDTT